MNSARSMGPLAGSVVKGDDPMRILLPDAPPDQRRWYSRLELRELLGIAGDGRASWQLIAVAILMAMKREVAMGEFTDRCKGDGWISITAGLFNKMGRPNGATKRRAIRRLVEAGLVESREVPNNTSPQLRLIDPGLPPHVYDLVVQTEITLPDDPGVA